MKRIFRKKILSLLKAFLKKNYSAELVWVTLGPRKEMALTCVSL